MPKRVRIIVYIRSLQAEECDHSALGIVYHKHQMYIVISVKLSAPCHSFVFLSAIQVSRQLALIAICNHQIDHVEVFCQMTPAVLFAEESEVLRSQPGWPQSAQLLKRKQENLQDNLDFIIV